MKIKDKCKSNLDGFPRQGGPGAFPFLGSLGAFTLVELIVVVTILALLSTIGFVSYSSYLSGVRDTNRLSQLVAISDGLELYRTKKTLPIPDDNIEIRANGTVIGYQGYAGINVLETIDYSKTGKDPKDKTYFSYYLTQDKKYYQLLTYLEEEENLETNNNLFSKTYADTDYTNRYPKVSGKKLGILTQSGTNIPVQEVTTIVSSGYLDLDTNTEDYIANLDDTNTISGTGKLLVVGATRSIAGTNKTSCKDILEKHPETLGVDGTYEISPTSTETVKVYCDMFNGGNTIIKVNGNKNYINEYSTCDNITVFTDSEISIIKNLKQYYSTVSIDTDLEFYIQADDSVNNSFINTIKISDLTDHKITMGYGADNTRLTLNTAKDKFYCDGNGGNKCGETNKPLLQTYSEALIITGGSFNPICNGSTANGDTWSRNNFSFKYSFYNVIFSN